jgi:YihY family inner membrane protein
LVLVSVLGILLGSRPDLAHRVLDSSLTEFPVIGDQLRSNVHSLDRSGLALAVGLVAAFIGARGLADTAQAAFNTLWQVPFVRRPGLPWSILRSLGMLVLIAVGVAVTGFGAIATTTNRPGAAKAGIALLVLLISVALFIVGFRLATASTVPTRQLVPGAAIAAAGWQILLALGALLVNHYLRGASQVYGAFATVIGMLAWFAVQAQVTLYAVEVDVVRAGGQWPRGLRSTSLTAADKTTLTGYAHEQARVAQEEIHVSFEPPAPAPPARRSLMTRRLVASAGAGLLVGWIAGRNGGRPLRKSIPGRPRRG